MSFGAKRELLVQVAPRYRAARRGQRSIILDEFVAVTGYDRKYAIRLLLGPIRPPEPIRRPRAAQHGCEVQQALTTAWTAANGICGKRLVPFDERRSELPTNCLTGECNPAGGCCLTSFYTVDAPRWNPRLAPVNACGDLIDRLLDAEQI